MVKPKTGILQNFTGRAGRLLAWVFPAFALLTFISSWAGAYPPSVVENWYARRVFPIISTLAGRTADAVSFSWLDVAIPLLVVLTIVLIRKRRWQWLFNVAAVLYLIFFWSWGLNYHRMPLASKLQFDASRTNPDAIEQFAKRAAGEINRLYLEKQKNPYDEIRIRDEAARRVSRVVEVIDGAEWPAAHRIKVSWVANPWLRVAGIDGVFNPIGHEPLINNSLLDIERPFVMAHELAHVRGYPDEGDANLVAVFATIVSNDPAFQYSGWLTLWLYLRNSELDKLLDPGPRADLQRIFQRARTGEIRWINNFQAAILDWFLKANSVDQGIRSYSRVVVLAAGTEHYWEHFR